MESKTIPDADVNLDFYHLVQMCGKSVVKYSNVRKDRKLTNLSEYDIIIINAAKYLLRCAVIKDIYDSIVLSWAGKDTHAVYGN